MKAAIFRSDYVAQAALRIFEARVGIYASDMDGADFAEEAARSIKAAEALQDALVETGHMEIEFTTTST